MPRAVETRRPATGVPGRDARFHLILLSLLLAAVTASPALAIDPDLPTTEYLHRVWGVDEGPGRGAISAIAQDERGYLWIGTDDGLYRFDGRSFLEADFVLGDGSASRRILSLFLDSWGTLWIGTDNGGYRLESDGPHRIEIPARLTELDVSRTNTPDDLISLTSFAEDDQGILWIGTNRGLVGYRPGEAALTYTMDDGLSWMGVNCLAVDRRGDL